MTGTRRTILRTFFKNIFIHHVAENKKRENTDKQTNKQSPQDNQRSRIIIRSVTNIF